MGRRRIAQGAVAFGGTLLLVATLIATLGPTHERVAIGHVEGHTVATAWFYAAVIVGGVGLALVIFGGVFLAAVNTSPITEAHAGRLRRSITAVEHCIERGLHCEYGDVRGGTLARDSFPHHFKRLKLEKRWEPMMGEYDDAVAAHHERTRREAATRTPAPQYASEHIADTLHAWTVEQARSSQLDAPLRWTWRGSPEGEIPSYLQQMQGRPNGAMSPANDPNHVWTVVTPTPGEDPLAWYARTAGIRAEVERLGADALVWPEAHAITTAYQGLNERGGELLEELRLIREKWPPVVARKCPGCR